MDGRWLRERRDALVDGALAMVALPLALTAVSLLVQLPPAVFATLGGFVAGTALSHIKKI